MSFLDPSVKDTVQLIQGAIEKMDIPQQERRGLYKDEFDRLTAIGKQRQADEEADRQERRAKVDAEVIRLRAENERFKQAKVDAFEAWDSKFKAAAKALVEEKWTEYYSKVKTSRANRNTLIEVARAACDEAVAPLKEKLRSDIDALGEEPPDGPRFSKESEIWWIVPTCAERPEPYVRKRSGCLQRREAGSCGGRKGLPSTGGVEVAERTVRLHRATQGRGLQDFQERS